MLCARARLLRISCSFSIARDSLWKTGCSPAITEGKVAAASMSPSCARSGCSPTAFSTPVDGNGARSRAASARLHAQSGTQQAKRSLKDGQLLDGLSACERHPLDQSCEFYFEPVSAMAIVCEFALELCTRYCSNLYKAATVGSVDQQIIQVNAMAHEGKLVVQVLEKGSERVAFAESLARLVEQRLHVELDLSVAAPDRDVSEADGRAHRARRPFRPTL